MKKIYKIYPLILVLLIGISCSDEVKYDNSVEEENLRIDRITVFMENLTRTDEDLEEGNDKEGDDNDDPSDDFNLYDYIPFTISFDNNTPIFVSQQTETMPAFQQDDVIYTYSLMEETDETSWEEGYNFAPDDEDDPLEWYKILAGGTNKGLYTLYALYFPKETKLRQTEVDGQIRYSVMQDQRGPSNDPYNPINLIKSDIFGAYHATGLLFTRLRFRLFHLMTYLRIRLYVPVFDVNSKTGFFPEALMSASLDHATPEFAVEWSTLGTSDASAPAISPLEGDGEIVMYQHPLDPEAEPIEIKYTDFIPKGYYEQPIEGDYDKVRVYDFSVIMPMQKGSIDESGQEINYSETDFLKFNLKSNSGASVNYYFNQSLSANSTGSNLDLKQGNFQFLELYVPRVGNKILLVSGNVNPWLHRTTSVVMTGSEVEK